MTIALVMIVRNEVTVLPRLLASVREHVDAYTIVDTGSTDDTIAVIERELDGIPGTLYRRPWVDFGHNRAQALALATGTADHLLLADADFEYAIEPGALDDLPDGDVLMVDVVEGSMRYGYTGILRSGPMWSYTGRTHEVLNYTDRQVGRAEGVTIVHHHDGGSRGDKFERDLALLDGLTDPRSTFYRAQTLACLGLDEEAAATYLERAAMGGWGEEVYYSTYRAGVLRDDVPTLLHAWSLRPTRLEALYEAVHRLRAVGAHEAAYALTSAVEDVPAPPDVLFVEPYVYDFAMDFEHALACQNTGRLDEAVAMYQNLLRLDGLPAAYREACVVNHDTAQESPASP